MKLLVEHAKKVGNEALACFKVEDGVGLTSLDCSMFSMMNQLVQNRNNNFWGGAQQHVDVNSAKQQGTIFKIVNENAAKREIVSSDYARMVTNILLDQVNEQGLTEMNMIPPISAPKFQREMKSEDKEDMIDSEEDKKDDKEEDKEEDQDEEEEEAPDSLKGLVICITGSLSKTRKEIEAVIKKKGGKFSSTINKSTTHLVCDDVNSGTTKLTKAKELGVKIVTEKFLSKFF